MPKPTKERTDKAREACKQVAEILRKHPEFDQFNPSEDLLAHGNSDHFTVITADIRFLKSGQAIFQTPPGPEYEDYDWPTLVGEDTLEKAAREAANSAGLRLTEDLNIYISPSEKGWVEVGYQFLHR